MSDSNNLHTLQYVNISVELKGGEKFDCYASELTILRDGGLQIASVKKAPGEGKYYFIPSGSYTKLELDVQNTRSGNDVIPNLKDYVV